jgi:ABC-2 type transport system permease protein
MVFGKFLAAFGFVLIMLGLTSVYPIVLILTGNPDLGTITASYIGTLLLSSCYIALGITFSAMTENQIVAGALTFASSLFFWLVSWATQSAGPVWEGILGYLSLITHFNNFSQGLIDTSNVIYYFSFAGFCLFVCHRILDSYRWR